MAWQVSLLATGFVKRLSVFVVFNPCQVLPSGFFMKPHRSLAAYTEH